MGGVRVEVRLCVLGFVAAVLRGLFHGTERQACLSSRTIFPCADLMLAK